MARPSKTGGKRSAAKARKASSTGGRKKAIKNKRRISPASTSSKRFPISDVTKELQEAREQQAATADILRVIASSPSDVQPVFEAIAWSANRLIGGFSTAVYRVVDDVVHLVAFTPTDPEADEALKAIFPLQRKQVPSLTMVQNGRTAQIADAETADEQSRRIAHARGWRSVTFTPLMNRGAFIGFIACTRREVGVLADHHVQLLRTFADQAVIAIENARLFDEVKARTEDLRQSLEYQTATSDVLSIISRSPTDVQPVFEAIAASALRLCGAKWSVVTRFDGAQLHLAALHNLSDPEGVDAIRKIFPRPLSRGGPTDRAILTGTVINLPDVLNDPEYIYQSISKVAGYRSHLAVPTIHDGNAIGAITVAGEYTAAFTERHVNLLKAFADQAVIAIENVRLFNETQEALEQQNASSDILRVISSSVADAQPVFDKILDSCKHLFGSDETAVLLLDSEDTITLGAYVGKQHDAVAASFPAPLEKSPAGRAIRERRVAHYTDVANDPQLTRTVRRVAQLAGYESMAYAPMLSNGRGIGAIGASRNKGSFSDKELTLLQTFADQAVIAIENARLFEEVQEKTRDLSEALVYQTGSSNILKVIASSPTDVEPVLKAIVESACELCEAYDAVVILKDGKELQLSAHHGPIPMNRQRWTDDRASASGRAMADRRPVHIHDVLSDEGLEFPIAREMMLADGCRTLLSAPLLREGEPIGAVALRRAEVLPFSEKQIALLQTFADQAVIAIGNVHLFEEVQARTRDLSEALTHQTAGANVLRVIASSPTDIGPVLDVIVQNACELCQAYDAIVRLKVENSLHAGAHYGPIPISNESWPIDRESLSGHVILDKEPIHVRDMQSAEGNKFPESKARALRLGHRTILSVPLVRDDESIGVIILRRIEVNPFSDKQVALLQTFADQAAIAIGNVRLFEQLQERTRELATSLDELRAAQDRLVQTEKLASLGQLTAGIAHEIKNPLNFVNNFAALSAELTEELNEVLERAEIADKIRAEVDELTGLLKDNLAKVVQHGERADSIVKNMLLHSREGSGEHRPVDINAIVEDSLNLAYHGARAEKSGFTITLRQNLDPRAGAVELYPQEITRALLNLISNGFYAATRRKTGDESFEPVLSASTRNLGKTVEIRIRDNGTGILPEVREKMFNPFFTTKPTGEGTGLGLSMTHDIIVKQHGGRIDVETEPGVFTEFIITLPRDNGIATRPKSE